MGRRIKSQIFDPGLLRMASAQRRLGSKPSIRESLGSEDCVASFDSLCFFDQFLSYVQVQAVKPQQHTSYCIMCNANPTRITTIERCESLSFLLWQLQRKASNIATPSLSEPRVSDALRTRECKPTGQLGKMGNSHQSDPNMTSIPLPIPAIP